MSKYLVVDPKENIEEEFESLKEAIKFASECCKKKIASGKAIEHKLYFIAVCIVLAVLFKRHG